MIDLLIQNARIHGKKELQNILCRDGKILDVLPSFDGQARETIDAKGYFVTPPFVESHLHLDAVLSMGMPRLNQSGTLLEGIQLWGELKPLLTPEAVKERALQFLHWSIAKGNLAVRSHVDTTDPSLMAVDVLLEVKEEMKDYIDLQLVAFPQDGVLRAPGGVELLKKALDKGIDVVGGIPHFERTMADGAESVRLLCEIAAERGLLVDMHCDETDDPMSRHIETLAYETQRLGLQGRVTGSHLTSMHSMDNYYVSKLLPLMAESEINCVCNTLINILIQGRHDSYPKRRGLMRVPELMDAGINVSLGHDCVMDPWYSLGSHDMLEVAHMGIHCLHMTGLAQMDALFDAVTCNAAKTQHLEGYGLEPGCNADMVILQADSKFEAIRLRANRLFVIRRGRVISTMPENTACVNIGAGDVAVDFCR
ncbi:MAG: amidohydrolase family protein [Desulfobacterales bacterium]|nr:amidohydrolase family protein [Desulfobacterales bacterium]